MADVSFLAEAMDAAGHRTNKALAQEAGVSPATVGRALKHGRCNPATADKMQAACEPHRIGPYMQTEAGQERDVLDDAALIPVLQDVPEVRRMDAWFAERTDGLVIVVGTRRRSSDGLLTWGAVVVGDGGVVGEQFGYSSHWPAKTWGRAVAAGEEPPEPHPFQLAS